MTAAGEAAPAAASQRLAAEIGRLFARHGLGRVHRVEPLIGGVLNQVVRVNGEIVLRTRPPSQCTGSLLREAALLPELQGKAPVAPPLASGLDDILGEYLLQEALPGSTLLQAWLATPDVNYREWWLTQWTAALQAIHQVTYPAPGSLAGGRLKPAASWRAYIEGRINRRIDELMRVPGADREMLLAIGQHLRRYGRTLEDQPCVLVHRDLHFGNVLVDGPRLSAILDFELAEAGPADYELDAILRFLRSPGSYLPEESRLPVNPRRFATVWTRLARSYPELFRVNHLRERLALYALDHALSCLVQAHACRWRGGIRQVQAAVDVVAEVLRGDYGPP